MGYGICSLHVFMLAGWIWKIIIAYFNVCRLGIEDVLCHKASCDLPDFLSPQMEMSIESADTEQGFNVIFQCHAGYLLQGE